MTNKWGTPLGRYVNLLIRESKDLCMFSNQISTSQRVRFSLNTTMMCATQMSSIHFPLLMPDS